MYYFSLLTRDKSNTEAKPSYSALALTLGRVARVLDWAYPPNPFLRRGKRLTMVVVVGGCVVFRKTRKTYYSYVEILRSDSF